MYRVNGWKKYKFKTQKRNKAENEFEKDFYELLNNAFLGHQWKRCEIVYD